MKTPVPAEILHQHVAVLGKTRSGKSSVMRGLVEQLLADHKPVCIVDPKGDWWGLKLAKDGKSPGYGVVIFGGEHADVPIDEHAGASVAELFATGNRPCLIDLGGWMVGARTRFWIAFASTLFKLTKGERWLAVDEIHNFAPKGKVFDADAGKALHWTNRIASEGLGKGVAMVFASQRPQKVHNDTLTSAETLIAMRVLHPSDRGAVADWIAGNGDSSGKEVLESLAHMDRGEGWVWSPEIHFGPTRVKFPMFQTYDSFRPQTVEDTRKLKGWAEVDLDEVREKLKAVVEKAKADDPRELRKHIADLERQLREKPKPSQAPAAAPPAPVLPVGPLVAASEDVAEAIDLVALMVPELVQKIAVTVTICEDLQKWQKAVAAKMVRLKAAIQKISARQGTPADNRKTLAVTYVARDRVTGEQVEITNEKVPYGLPKHIEELRPVADELRRKMQAGHGIESAGDLTGTQRKILDTLVELERRQLTPTKEMIARWLNIHPNGRRYNGDLSALRRDGYLDGLRLVGPGAERRWVLAVTYGDGIPGLKEHLDGTKRRIVEQLAAVSRSGVRFTKDALAEELGIHPNGRRFNGDLSWLRTMGVIPERGDLYLTEAVWR